MASLCPDLLWRSHSDELTSSGYLQLSFLFKFLKMLCGSYKLFLSILQNIFLKFSQILSFLYSLSLISPRYGVTFLSFSPPKTNRVEENSGSMNFNSHSPDLRILIVTLIATEEKKCRLLKSVGIGRRKCWRSKTNTKGSDLVAVKSKIFVG